MVRSLREHSLLTGRSSFPAERTRRCVSGRSPTELRFARGPVTMRRCRALPSRWTVRRLCPGRSTRPSGCGPSIWRLRPRQQQQQLRRSQARSPDSIRWLSTLTRPPFDRPGHRPTERASPRPVTTASCECGTSSPDASWNDLAVTPARFRAWLLCRTICAFCLEERTHRFANGGSQRHESSPLTKLPSPGWRGWPTELSSRRLARTASPGCGTRTSTSFARSAFRKCRLRQSHPQKRQRLRKKRLRRDRSRLEL